METKILIASYALALAVTANLHAAPAPSPAPAEGVTGETSGAQSAASRNPRPARRAGGEWRKIAAGETKGHGTKKSIAPVNAQKFRVTMECEKGSPGGAELQLYPAE